MSRMERLSTPLRRRTVGLVLASGLLTVVSHPDASFSLAAWVALVPLLIALRDVRSWKEAARIGWFTGFVAFLGIIGWIVILAKFMGIEGPFAWVLSGTGAVLLAAYLALYIGLFAVLIHLFVPRAGFGYIVGVAVVWVFGEWLRGWMLTGFPWGSLGSSQWNRLAIAQLAALGGVPLLSFLLAFVNATFANAFFRRPERRRVRIESVPALVLVVAALVYGNVALRTIPPPIGSIRVAVVPGNVPQTTRWSRRALSENLDLYLRLMEKAVAEKPELIVLPETSVLYAYLRPEDRDRFHAFLSSRGLPILFGMPKVSRRGDLREGYNAVVLMDPEGDVLGEYHKQHLVPFGEYIPLRKYLPSFITDRVIGVADYNFGKESNVLVLPRESGDVRIGTPICFESVFPNISREFVQNGANVLIVVTNDGWYEGTAALAQHNAFSVFRAIETRRAVVRAANRGFSEFITPEGRILPGGIRYDDSNGIIVDDVPLMSGTTIAVRFGDWVSILSVFGVAVLVAEHWRRRRRETGSGPA